MEKDAPAATSPIIEARFRLALTDQLPVLLVSEGVEDLLGFALEEFLVARVSLKDRIHPHDFDIANTLFSRDSQNKSGTFNIRLRHANGKIRCIRGVYEKHSDTGTADATLDLLLQDAKSLKRTLDDAVGMANFRAIMENTDDYIYFKDRNHVFTGASQSLVSLCNPAEHWTDLLGQTDYDVFPEEYADIYYHLEKQVFAGISVAHEIQETLTKDGIRGWVDNRKYPIHNDRGEIIGLYGIARDITESKLAEDVLHEAKDKFQSLVESSSDWIWEVDENAVYTYTSPKVKELLGYEPHEVIGKTPFDLMPPEEKIRVGSQFEKIIRGKKAIVRLENRSLHKDGHLVVLETSGVPVFTKEGKFSGYRGVDRDITERKKAEEKLQINQFVSDNAPECIFWSDRQARILYANKAASRELGYSKKELLNMSVQDIDPDMPATAWPAHWQDLQQKNAITMETRHRRKDGSFFPVELSVNLIKFGDAEFNVAFSRNITERKQAEEALRIASVAFESQESMVITDAEGVILQVNQAFTETNGYTAEETVGQTLRLIRSERHDAGFYHAMWETLQHTGKWQGEIWNRRKNGEVYPALLSISAVKGDDGAITHYVSTGYDITERKAAEEGIRNLAFYDSLTRLPNRRLLNDRLVLVMATSKRSGRYGALMFLDLDNFKLLNDTHGHSVGDLLLVEVAHRIARAVREVDTVARFGGDEFVVVLSELDEDKTRSASQAGIIAEKVRVALGEPYVLKFQHEGEAEMTVEHHCTSSIGVVLFVGRETSEEDIIKNADRAMYLAKEAGRNQVRFYESEI